MKYIALLRGINVSGKNMIPMAALKQSFEKYGFRDVKTYIQSGNIVFQSEKITDEKQLFQEIRELIKKDFNADIPVIVRTPEELAAILKNKPFPDLLQEAEEKMHVTLLSDIPNAENISRIEKEKYLPDRFEILNREIFLYCPNGYGNTKLNNNFFESKLKVSATTRNLRTMKVLLSMV